MCTAKETFSRWPHRLAWLAVSTTFLLILVGAVVTGDGAACRCPTGRPPTAIGFTR